jgi:hypothetical protein
MDEWRVGGGVEAVERRRRSWKREGKRRRRRGQEQQLGVGAFKELRFLFRPIGPAVLV